MEGKYSLKHLYNNGKSSQMKPQEFIDMINWLDQNADGMIGEAVEVTEKIDGSSNFIGYDGRIYVEKFGFDKKFYDESDFDGNVYEAKAKALLDFAQSVPELEDYLEDLCEDNSCSSVKVQIEVLMTQFTKDPSVCQIVLVPYQLDKLGKDGSGFIIQVLNGDTLKPVEDEKIAVDTLCDILSTENFHVTGTNPKQFTPIDIKEDIQEVKNIIADYTESMGKSVEEILTSRKRSEAEMKKALKAEIESIQEALQDKLTEAFPVGDYGDYYEGLVFKLTNGMMFKVTSKKFKQFIAEHNHWSEALENKYGRLTEAEESIGSDVGSLTIANDNYFDETDGIENDTDIPEEINKIKEEIFSSVYKLENGDFQECKVEEGENLLKKYFCPNSGQSLYFQKPSSVTNSLLYVSSATIVPSENKIPNAKLSGITSELTEAVSKVLQDNKLQNNVELEYSTSKSKMNKELLENLEENKFYIQNNDTQSLQRKIIYINDNKVIYRLILATTGGKHCKGLCFFKDGPTIQTIVATSSKSQFKGLTSTNIQECISGALLYEVLFTEDKDKNATWKENFDNLCESLTKSETTEQLYGSLAGIKLKDKPGYFSHYHFQTAYVGKGGENTSLALFKPSISGALHDWTESLKNIKDVNIKLEKADSEAANNRLTSYKNTLLFHSSFLYSPEVSEGKEPRYIINPDTKQLLDEYLFSDSFFKKSSKEDGPKSFRDEVNPSDIYLISKDDINKIIQLFGSVEQLSQGTDTLKTLLDRLMEFFKEAANQNDFLVKARAYIGSTEENSIINTIYNDFVSSRENFPSYKDEEVSIYNNTEKTMKDLEALINSMLGRSLREKTSTTRSHLINICRNTTFARILSEKIDTETLKEFLNNDDVLMTLVSYGKDPIPKSVAYATIHNFLTQQRYIAGISLKKLATNGAFTFTGGTKFFLANTTANRDTIQPTIGRNMLVYDSNNLDNCTLQNLHIAVGVPEGASSPTQGGLKIICDANQSHVHGTTLSKQKNSLKYDLRGILSLIREENPLIMNGLMLDHILEDSNKIINFVSSYIDKDGKKWFVNNGQKVDVEDKNSVLTLDVRTNGNGVVIESGVGGSAAQGGKATNAFNKLYKGSSSSEQLSQEEMEKGLTGLSKEAKAEKLRYYLKILSQSVLDFLGLQPAYSTTQNEKSQTHSKVGSSDIETLYSKTFSDETLNKALDVILACQENEEKETRQWAVVCFKLTLLFARALKYQIFIEGDLSDTNIKNDSIETSKNIQQSLNTFKSYFKYHVNLSSVAYYKLS